MPQEKQRVTIRCWLPGERPRERLLDSGPPALSEAELLAVLLGSGTRGTSAVALARRILEQAGGLSGLQRLPLERLLVLDGIGPAKAAAIGAAMEIGNRLAQAPGNSRVRIRESRDAHQLMRPVLSRLEHEEFWVVYLNNANAVISRFQLSKGGLTGTLVDVRLLLRRALELGAVSLVLVHNHPSGNLQPSNADRQITRKIVKAAHTMDIRVLDHLILGGTTYFSFADEQLL
ncbi:DNA repair protein RadC [Robiginitalea sp. SC105]|uniref:RadC family protein n=1 Tax=Robiginitalea sp. SC105 TaxID=2762332 RepID=UPI00163B0E4C|nr:DNA repair protein RadC [Robiginitalea sp. SC105]MBC2839602.1 DNA repair protein RadC [Robiginitalea sp. SC105]